MSNETQRETKKITTAGGHEVEVHTYITGREDEQIEDIFSEQMELKMKGVKGAVEQEISGIQGSVMKKMDHKAIELIVVSVDGKTENILNTLLDFDSKDYKEIKDYVKELRSGKKNEESPEQKQTT